MADKTEVSSSSNDKGEVMSVLIKTAFSSIGGNEVNSVNLRDVHAYVESKQRFADWAKNRLSRAVESVDFTLFHNVMKNPFGGRPQTDYIVTVDYVKMICMLENNVKGDELRRYFIDCEKKLLSQPKTESFRINESIKRAERWIEEQKASRLALENAKPKAPALTTTYIEALKALVISEEGKALAQQEAQEKQQVDIVKASSSVIMGSEIMYNCVLKEVWEDFKNNGGAILTTDFVKNQGVSSAAKFNNYLIKRGILCERTKPNKPHTPRDGYEAWFKKVDKHLWISGLGIENLFKVLKEAIADGDIKLAKVK